MDRPRHNVAPRLVDPEPISPGDVHIDTSDEPRAFAQADTLSQEAWISIGRHIVLAAVLLPVTVAAVLMVLSTVWGVATLDGWLMIEAAVWGLGIAVMGGVYAFAGALIVTAITIALLVLIDQTVRLRMPPTIVGALTGGFVGGAIAAVAFVDEPLPALGIVVLATTMGTYGGAIGGWRSNWRFTYQQYDGHRYANNPRYKTVEPKPFRFGIRQMMIASAWLCGLLGIAKGVGLLTPRVMLGLGIWFAIQVVVMLVGYFTWPAYTRWRVRLWERQRSQP
jgi:hypothetical protein